MTKVKTTTINTKVMCSKRKRVTFARAKLLHEGILMQEDTFARRDTFAGRLFCTR